MNTEALIVWLYGVAAGVVIAPVVALAVGRWLGGLLAEEPRPKKR